MLAVFCTAACSVATASRASGKKGALGTRSLAPLLATCPPPRESRLLICAACRRSGLSSQLSADVRSPYLRLGYGFLDLCVVSAHQLITEQPPWRGNNHEGLNQEALEISDYRWPRLLCSALASPEDCEALFPLGRVLECVEAP
ncbi:hypothetical protein NDU88_006612 [Pleurodeles waltl]|uniref:Secreted protein n=1 Tax=Pleurodeles waltl TaxID=8319 RepID=A0AAV7WE44_PLEWA|nr:hypothetical protein NDU88_006612 [Pleurodeles waltl]